MARQQLPDGYHSVIPDLAVDGAAKAIEFYKNAFGAEEKFRMQGDNGCIYHAELRIGDTVFFLADARPELGYLSPKEGGAGVSLILNVDDVDVVFRKAVQAGASVIEAVQDYFWGDRMGTVRDPFGHVWSLSTHVRDVSDEEIQREAAVWMDRNR